MSHETYPPVGVGASGDGPREFGLAADLASWSSPGNSGGTTGHKPPQSRSPTSGDGSISDFESATSSQTSSQTSSPNSSRTQSPEQASDGDTGGSDPHSSSSGSESGNRRLLEQPSEPDWSSLYFPPRNNTDTGDRGDDGDVEQDVVYSKRTPFDGGYVDPAANDLMRALFLPIFSCPLNDDPGAHPLCASVYKAQARDAWVAYYHESNRLNALLETQMMASAELRRLLADTQDMHMNGEEFHASRIKDLRSRLDKSEFELSEIAKQKQAVDARVTQIEEQKGCDARIVEALNSVTDKTSLNDALKGLTMCDAEQNATAKQLLEERIELLDFRRREQQRIEDVRLTKEREEEIAAKARESMSKEVKFLSRVLNNLKETQINDFTDDDHGNCLEDIVKFARDRLKLEHLTDDPTTLSEQQVRNSGSDDGLFLYADILELLIQKAGKIRMVVRFRNKDIIDRDNNEISVKNSYNIGVKNNNIMKHVKGPGEFDIYYASLMKGQKKGDKEQLKRRFDALDDESKRKYANYPFEGYRLDVAEETPKTYYRTLRYSLESSTVDEHSTLRFERVFFEEDQEHVFDSLRPFIWSAANGKPMGIFAYGGTGSGKTHTLLGPKDDPGILTKLLEEQINDRYTTDIEVRILETHPRKVAGKKLAHRVIDLVGLSRNDAIEAESDGPSINSIGSVSFYEIETINVSAQKHTTKKRMVMKTTPVLKKSKFKDIYDKDDLEINNVTYGLVGFEPEEIGLNVSPLILTNNDDIVSSINEVLAYRRTESTRGNVDGSSRSHLVVSIKVNTSTNLVKKFFVVDMAGKEVLFSNPQKGRAVNPDSEIARQLQTSQGINQSLDAFTRYIALTKCKTIGDDQKTKILEKYPIRGSNAAGVDQALIAAKCVGNGIRMPHEKDDGGKTTTAGYVQNNNTQIYGQIRYEDDPLFFLTNDIWSDKDSKIMLFACVYPLVKERVGDDLKPSLWNTHFNEKETESLETKFKRDVGILREMDYIQKIQKKEKTSSQPPQPPQPQQPVRRSVRFKKV